MQTTIEVVIMCQEQWFKSRNKEEDDEVKPSCQILATIIWVFRFFFFSSRILYRLSVKQRWHLRCLTTSCSGAPPDWQLWSALWQTTRLQGIEGAGTPPSHKLPKKSKLLWERSTPGSQLPRKIMTATINKHKLRECSRATGPPRQANKNRFQWFSHYFVCADSDMKPGKQWDFSGTPLLHPQKGKKER